MQIKLAYGKETLALDIPDNNLLGVLRAPVLEPAKDNQQLIDEALARPFGTPGLAEIIKRKKAGNAVVIVNDITRPTPYQNILPQLLREIESGGISPSNITLVVALGIHRPHTREENELLFGAEICHRYLVENHDCDRNLASVGRLNNGQDLLINRRVAEADLLVTTGVVGLHYFAGYSGGRKSILPGVASRSLIESNHRLMDDHRACLGNYEDNPVSQIMVEAARLAGVDFNINVVTTGKERIVYAAAGDVYESWINAVQACESMNVLPIEEKADIVVASCGGYPKDINVYQAQKALDAAILAVKPGGLIILAAECREGLGEETFSRWLEEASCPQDIISRFHRCFELGGHKAYAICRALEKVGILLYSSLTAEVVRSLYMEESGDLQGSLDQALTRMGENCRVWVMPEAPKIAVKLVQC